MSPRVRAVGALAAALLLTFVAAGNAGAQDALQSLPNPYRAVENWAKMPDGRNWGTVAGMGIDRKGNVWVFERCGAGTCAGSSLAPILEFDPSGKLLKSFGAEMFVMPHGLYVDKADNVWVTDGDGKDGKGQQVMEFSPDGKVLLTLGKPGVAGDDPDTFNRPSGVVVAANGDIFVADGHGGKSNARVVKFSKDGKFIKTWGEKGSDPGDFDEIHAIAIDAQGRVLVADRGNNRIQIFDQDGKFLDQWPQFGRPSGVYVDDKGMVYAPDNTDTRYPDWKKGIRIGNTKDGSVTAFIPGPDQDPKHVAFGPESVVVDANGNIYASEGSLKEVIKYVKQ